MKTTNQILLFHHGDKGYAVLETLRREFEQVKGIINSDVAVLIDEGKAALANNFFEVVIFDINFPQAPYGGLELFRSLHNDFESHWEKSIFLTIYAAGKMKSAEELREKIGENSPLNDTERVYHFADNYSVDRNNILGPFSSGYESLKKRIRDLLI